MVSNGPQIMPSMTTLISVELNRGGFWHDLSSRAKRGFIPRSRFFCLLHTTGQFMEHKLQCKGALCKDRTGTRDQTGAKECLVFTGALKNKQIRQHIAYNHVALLPTLKPWCCSLRVYMLSPDLPYLP